MPTVSTEDAAIIRRRTHAIGITLCIWKKRVIGTAKVNGTPDYDDIVADIAIDNESVDWPGTRRGLLVEIYRSGVLIYQGAIRRPNADDDHEIRISAQREGDTGTAQMFGQSIADNDDVILYDAILPWSVLSRLDDDGDLLKRFDQAFDPSYPQSRYFEPHARFGTHRHVRVAQGSDAALEFTQDITDYSNNGTLEHEWFIPDEWAYTGGTDEFDDTITVDAPAGDYLLRLNAARTGGVEASDLSTGFRYVFVTDGRDGDNPAFSDLFSIVTIDSIQDRVGRTDTYTVKCNAADETLLREYFFPGAFCLFQEDPSFSDDAWETYGAPTAGLTNEFTGHLRRFDLVSEDYQGVQTWRVTFQSWLLYCAALPIPTQVMYAEATPTEWYHVYPDNMNIAAALFIILFYHTEMTRWYDCYFEDLASFERFDLRFDRGSLLASMQQLVAYRTGANIGCASDGTLYARRHGSFESTGTRAAIPTVWTWAAGDIRLKTEHARDPIMKVGQLAGAGLVSGVTLDAAAARAQFGYLASAQGLGIDETPGFIGVDEADIAAVIGHAWQNRNRAVDSLPVDVLGNRDVIDPARMEWHKLDIAAKVPLSDEAFGTTRRWLPQSVSRTYELTERGIIKRISANFEPETFGYPATIIPLSPELGTTRIAMPTPPPAPYDPCTAFSGTDYGYHWDFTQSDGGFSATYGDWVAGVGWVQEYVAAGVQAQDVLSLFMSAPTDVGRVLRYIEAEIYLDVGQRSGSGLQPIFAVREPASPFTTHLSKTQDFNGVASAAPNTNLRTGLRIISQPAVRQALGAPAPNPRGTITLVRLSVFYDGDDADFSGGEAC